MVKAPRLRICQSASEPNGFKNPEAKAPDMEAEAPDMSPKNEENNTTFGRTKQLMPILASSSKSDTAEDANTVRRVYGIKRRVRNHV